MSQAVSNFVELVRSQKQGFSFGKPQRIGEKSLSVILPIIRETSVRRGYVTFPETEKVMVFDTGKIDQMDATNEGDDHVFIRSGTLFRGSTQERALQRSSVILGHTKSRLNVRCVHASRGISSGSKTVFGGYIPVSMENASYTAGFVPKDQGSYWANVQSSNTMMMRCMDGDVGTAAPTVMSGIYKTHTLEEIGGIRDVFKAPKMDDLASNLDKFSLTFDDVLSKVKIAENQAGLALINDVGVQTIEVFDHHDSWKALHESAVKRMGTELLKEDSDSVFEFKPDNAVSAVDKVLAMDWKMNEIFNHHPSNGEPAIRITGLSAGEFVGEAVEMDGKVIHLVILRKAS